MMRCSIATLFVTFSLVVCRAAATLGSWRDEVLDVELQVGYAVRAIDLSGDGRLDIAIVDSKRFIWLENPTWTLHVMHADPAAANDNVCFAPHDIDGDGDTDFAVGRDWQPGNSDSGGEIGWLRCPADPRDAWTYIKIDEEPTTHRMTWIDVDADGKGQLIVAPLKGRGSRPPGFENTSVRLLSLVPTVDGNSVSWDMSVLDDSLHVSHNVDVVDLDRDGKQDLIVASFEGVTSLISQAGEVVAAQIASGQSGTAPAMGASEVRLGSLAGDARYLATIEPWHGDKVVIYTEPTTAGMLWNRLILDEELMWGHAVACANLDDDPDDELIIGVRDDASAAHRCGVRIYNLVDAANSTWQRSLVAPGQVAVEDMVAADFDGDGDVDIVAVGRATHNAVIYWNESP